MDKFLETYNLPTLNLEESKSPNRQNTPNEIEAVIKKKQKKKTSQQTKALDQMDSHGEFYQTF